MNKILTFLVYIILFSYSGILSCQSIEIKIKNPKQKYSSIDTIRIEVKNKSSNVLVFTLSIQKFVENKWLIINDNVFDEDQFLNQKHSVNIMCRVDCDSTALFNYTPDAILKNNEIPGTFKFCMHYRCYNNADEDLIQTESESFIVTSIE